MALPQPLVVGNWKMHGLWTEAEPRLRAFDARLRAEPQGGLFAVCPPFTLLHPAATLLDGSPVLLGAQSCHGEDDGAFTGDVSAPMLKEAGCRFVIVGHSERRHGLGETDADVRAKADAVLAQRMTPIVCVGETEAQYVAGRTLDVLSGQLAGSLPEPSPADVVVAYEPVWAIGTGRTPSLDEIADTHAHIASRLDELGLGGSPILYGGSVKAENAGAIMKLTHVGGVLVGGASLEIESFWGIYQAGTQTA